MFCYTSAWLVGIEACRLCYASGAYRRALCFAIQVLGLYALLCLAFALCLYASSAMLCVYRRADPVRVFYLLCTYKNKNTRTSKCACL